MMPSSDAKASLAQDGFVVLDLLDDDDLRALRVAHSEFPQQSAAGFTSTILSSDLALRASVDQAVRSVLEPRLWNVIETHRPVVCTFVTKRAGCADGEVPVHQDWSFVDERRYTSFGIWCPLVDVDATNGCLGVVRGSHAAAHPPRAVCSAFLYPEFEPALRNRYMRYIPMRAGQALLFDNRLFHCSPPNQAKVDRIAATAVIVPTGATLRYYHIADRGNPHILEVFDVDDDFYISHIVPNRPKNNICVGTLNIAAEFPPSIKSHNQRW